MVCFKVSHILIDVLKWIINIILSEAIVYIYKNTLFG